jgi:hypothetical protein
MEPYFAVGAGIILALCGYELGKQRGFRDGIEFTFSLMLFKELVTEQQLNELDLDLDDN